MSQSARQDPEGHRQREGEHKPYEPVKATRPEATAGDRELAFVRKWIETDESEGVQRTALKELRELIATRLAAATAKEKQARELAEGEVVEARKGWAYFAGWSASSQKYEVCHWQGRDPNVPKFDTLEAAWEEAERRSIAARVNGLMPLAPAPAGGEPE